MALEWLAGEVDPRGWPLLEHSRTLELDHVRWHVQVLGEGPAVLLLHGTGASSHSFRALLPALARHFTVVAPDLPGHRYSLLRPGSDSSLPGIAAALGHLVRRLGVSPVAGIGHSAGAALLARMTLDGALAPRFLVGMAAAMAPPSGLSRVLFSPAARLLSRSWLGSWLVAARSSDVEQVARLLEGTGSSLPPEGVELYRRLAAHPGHVAGVLAMLARWDLVPLFEDLGRLHVPFLLVAGERDRAVPFEQQRRVAQRLPDAWMSVVSGAGHLVHEEQPARVEQLVLTLAREHRLLVEGT